MRDHMQQLDMESKQSAQRVRLGVKHVLVQGQDGGRTKQQVQILERLGQGKGGHLVIAFGGIDADALQARVTRRPATVFPHALENLPTCYTNGENVEGMK
jgi:hypothetical protein